MARDRRMRRYIKSASLIVLLYSQLLLLQSCGFHLRKWVELPPEVQQIAIQDIAIGSELAPVVQLHLRRSGIDTLPTEEGAKLILQVQGESYKRRVMTVSALGQVQEYELIYTVKYSINNVQHGDASIKDQSLVVKRDLRFNPNEILGTASEETRLKQEMIDSAVDQIIRRLPKAVPNVQS